MTLRPTDSLELGFAGSAVNAEFDSTVRDGTGAVLGGIREGNRLPSVPELQFTASLTYNFKLAGRESYVTASYQHVGSRFTQPSDQESNPRTFVHGLPFQGAPATAATAPMYTARAQGSEVSVPAVMPWTVARPKAR